MEQPFTDLHYRGPYGLFTDKTVERLVSLIDTINTRAAALCAFASSWQKTGGGFKGKFPVDIIDESFHNIV